MSSLIAALASLALAQSAPMTQAGREIAAEETARLERCIEMTQSDPEAAYEEALAWIGNGNRPHARHCTALALLALGHEDEAAARLEDLANAPDAGGETTRALYLSQSGNAWLAAGYPGAAVVTLSNALKLVPDDPDLLTDRALAHLALDEASKARIDLTAALALRPGDATALGLRARALARAGRYDAALADIRAARVAAPDDIDLLVLRGDIREAQRKAQ